MNFRLVHPDPARTAPVHMDGVKDVRMEILVGRQHGAPNFSMRHFVVEPGGHTPHHQHDYEHEILILKGNGRAQSAAGERTFKAGDVIWVPPNEMHQFVNTGPTPLEFICLIPAPKDCSR